MKQGCIICGALWEEGKGFVEDHISPCANERYGYAFTREVPDDWERPAKCVGTLVTPWFEVGKMPHKKILVEVKRDLRA